MKWFHSKITALMVGRPRLVLAGISAGGVMWEDYIQWRTRMGHPPIDGLILWSNPTMDLWCQHMGGDPTNLMLTLGDWTPDIHGPWETVRGPYGTTLAGQACDEKPPPTAGYTGSHNFSLGPAGQAKYAEMEASTSGHEARGFTWIEEHVDFQKLGNCPNETLIDMYVDIVGGSVPHIHWTDAERAAKRKLRKLIMFASTTSAPERPGTPDCPGEACFSWPGMQAHVQATCTHAKSNCKLEYVPLEPWTLGITMPGLDTSPPHASPNLSSTFLWGHWLQAANPVGFRERVQAWV